MLLQNYLKRFLDEDQVHFLVNYNILGGWKYVNKQTGEFFNDENDFDQSLQTLLNNYDNYQPNQYFSNNYGNEHTGVELRDFLLKHLSNCQDSDYFEKGLDLAIKSGLKVTAVDILDFFCMEIDFSKDLETVNNILRLNE